MNSRLSVTTDEESIRALEDTGVGRELAETNLETKEQSDQGVINTIITNRTVGNFTGEFPQPPETFW